MFFIVITTNMTVISNYFEWKNENYEFETSILF